MAPAPTPMSPAARESAVTAMACEELDILVIGAGVVGAGAALDAASRGLRVGLVEARDLASGTSSRSSKLFHGGLRYLKQLDFPLVFEALRERELMLQRLCPHLGRPVPFLFPLERKYWDRAYVGLGVGVYDVLGAGRGVPSHMKHLSRAQANALFRSAKPDSLHGGVLFYEGQLDDARHTMMLARTAAAHGAHVATSVQVTDLLKDGERVVGAVARDLEGDRVLDVRARRVINATGVWTEQITALVGGQDGLRVKASKGVHILVPRSTIDCDTGLITETEKSLLFVIPCPWSDDLWLIGTTDTPWEGDLADPAASQADIDYLLERVNGLLAEPIRREDVLSVYTGLRPLISPAGGTDTARLSREHAVVSPAPGLIAVAGGKYTTYRVMAADAVDAAVEDWPHEVPPSRTDRVPLVGADGYHDMVARTGAYAAEHGVDPRVITHLLGRYGSATTEVLDLMRERPDLARPIGGATRYLRAEAHYAASHEGALHLDDVLVRRLRIALDSPARGADAAAEAARVVAVPLGWDEATIDREVDVYLSHLSAELRAQTQPDDASADAAQGQADDVRHVVSIG